MVRDKPLVQIDHEDVDIITLVTGTDHGIVVGLGKQRPAIPTRVLTCIAVEGDFKCHETTFRREFRTWVLLQTFIGSRNSHVVVDLWIL